MTLARTGDLVDEARRAGTGVPAYNVITLEHAEGIAAGAERAATPVILQISQNAVAFHGGRLGPIAAGTLAVAESAQVPVAVHLDHVTDTALLDAAATAGLSSAMYDGGALPHIENIARTREAADALHTAGLWVEAELGYVGGKPDSPLSAHAPGVLTDPVEAAEFVAATGVDALAVAVGSTHAMTARVAALDLERIAALRSALDVPLVLHGSSGVPDPTLRAAVEAGITKVNIGTALNVALTHEVRRILGLDPGLVDPRRYLGPARDKLAEVVESMCRVVSSSA